MPEAEILDLATRAEGALLATVAGDALGWPQEDRGGRIGGGEGTRPRLEYVDWRRRSGGRYASHEEAISAGEYSDDTQLVLAVARSRGRGEDWWHWLTRVELPFWLLYERGGGGASKRSARSWSHGTPPWLAKEAEAYFAAGGNGVAMRVLAHAIRGGASDDFSPVATAVFADGIATHGHPRAHVGALVYAYALWSALRRSGTLDYGALIGEASAGVEAWAPLPGLDVAHDWRAVADSASHTDYEGLWAETVAEMIDLLAICARAIEQGPLAVDRETLADIGAFGPSSGAGTVAAASAIFVASRYASQPIQGLLAGAFAQGADTDTLAAMAGGILGAINGADWLGRTAERLQDYSYLRAVAPALTSTNPEQVSGESVNPRRFWKVVTSAAPGEEIDLPDGRRATVRDTVDHPTLTRNEIKTWRLLTSDGQTLYLKKLTRLRQPKPYAEPESAQPSSRRRAVVAVEAADIERSVAFYRDVVGLELTRSTPEYVSFGGVVVLVPAPNGARAPEQMDLDGFTRGPKILVFIERAELDEVRERAVVAKAQATSFTETNGRRIFQCLDPDGTVVELREANGS